MHEEETTYREKGSCVNRSRSPLSSTRMSNDERRNGVGGEYVNTSSTDEPVVTSDVAVHRRISGGDFDQSVSVTVVEALAEAEGVSPLDVEEPLYEAVDPDALDRLLSSSGTTLRNGRVEFSISGFQVAITVDDDDLLVCVYKSHHTSERL
jgi:hypothetical protein